MGMFDASICLRTSPQRKVSLPPTSMKISSSFNEFNISDVPDPALLPSATRETPPLAVRGLFVTTTRAWPQNTDSTVMKEIIFTVAFFMIKRLNEAWE